MELPKEYEHLNNFQRIIVTGCAGFIGWKVSEMLLDLGKEVIGIDNINDAYDVRLKEWRLNQLLPRDKFKFYKLDISQKETIFDFFNQINANSGDAIINLAARAGVRQSLENPWVYYETNAIGTLNLLECCKNRGIKNLSWLQHPVSTATIIRYRSAKMMTRTGPYLPMLLQKKLPKHYALHTIICTA